MLNACHMFDKYLGVLIYEHIKNRLFRRKKYDRQSFEASNSNGEFEIRFLETRLIVLKSCMVSMPPFRSLKLQERIYIGIRAV